MLLVVVLAFCVFVGLVCLWGLWLLFWFGLELLVDGDFVGCFAGWWFI